MPGASVEILVRSVGGDFLSTTHMAIDVPVPAEPGEIGLVPEYAMVDLLASGDSASNIRGAELLAGTDYTAMLRYTWLPT